MVIKNKIITKQDLIRLNAEPDSCVVLNNTLGQNPDIVEQIPSKVKLQVFGAYNPKITSRFIEPKYQERTFYSAPVLASAIRQMEEIEKEIKPNWTQFEKALFVFDKLVKNVEYDYDQKYKNHNRNLEALVNGFSRCAGFAVCYKEMMDRLGIENEFKNIANLHSFNVLNIDDKKFIVDVTWARNNYDDKKEYLHNFGCFKDEDLFITHKLPTENVHYDELKLDVVTKTLNNLSKQKNATLKK